MVVCRWWYIAFRSCCCYMFQVVTRLVPANALVAMSAPLSAKNLQLPDSTAKPVAMDTCLATKSPVSVTSGLSSVPMETITKPVEFPAEEVAETSFPIQENLELDAEGGGSTTSLLDTVMSPAAVVG